MGAPANENQVVRVEDTADTALLTRETAFLKHLEFIQAAITRQAGNSSLIRGWALTLATALFGFSAHSPGSGIAAIALIPTVAFYVLDAYYLRQERLFRCLYTAVIAPGSRVPALSMDVSPYRDAAEVQWRAVLRSRPLLVLYGFILAAGVIVVILTAI